MPLEGEYEPSTQKWVRDQVELYERTGGREGSTLRDTGLPVVVFSTRGVKSGKGRKQPLMKVECDGAYLMVGSQGGASADPAWVSNLRAAPDQVTVQDGPQPWDGAARALSGHDPAWVSPPRAAPDQVPVQDGPDPWDGVARELSGDERAEWWDRAVAAFPNY